MAGNHSTSFHRYRRHPADRVRRTTSVTRKRHTTSQHRQKIHTLPVRRRSFGAIRHSLNHLAKSDHYFQHASIVRLSLIAIGIFALFCVIGLFILYRIYHPIPQHTYTNPASARELSDDDFETEIHVIDGRLIILKRERDRRTR